MSHIDRDLPMPGKEAEQITPYEFQLLTEKFELVDGYIVGKNGEADRLALLRLLLRNCGLGAAAGMCDPFEFREVCDREFADFFAMQDKLYEEAVADGSVRVERWDGEGWVPDEPESEHRKIQAGRRVMYLTINM